VLLQICNPIFSSGRNGAIIRVAKFIFMLGKNQECWADFFFSDGWQMYVYFIFIDIVLLKYLLLIEIFCYFVVVVANHMLHMTLFYCCIANI
jgi:hypothetical protein